MEIQKCGACNDTLSDGVNCTSCNQILHFHCSGITEAGYRKLGDRKLTWRCIKCKQVNTQTPSSPRSPYPESNSTVLMEIRALSSKLAPLEGLKNDILALRSEFADLKSSLNQQFNDVVKEFATKIQDMEQRITQMEVVHNQVDNIQLRLDKLEEESDRKDQWSRMNNIEIKGLPQSNNENLFDLISKIGTKIKYQISKTQINFVTRVPSQQKDNIKPIIVRFCNRYAKEDFVAAARYESKTSPLTTNHMGLPGNHKIYINDHLTLKNKNLLSKTKKLAAEKDFRYVWVKHAKIYIRKMDTSPVILVKSEQEIAKLV